MITSLHDDNWIFLDRKPSILSSLSSSSSEVFQTISPNTQQPTEKYFFSNNNKEQQEEDETTLQNLTNSSCHSDRSMARLNCLTLIEEEKQIVKQEKEEKKFISICKIDVNMKPNETSRYIKINQESKTECLTVKKLISNVNKLKSISEEKQETTNLERPKDCMFVLNN